VRVFASLSFVEKAFIVISDLSLSLSPWVRFQTHCLASQRETLVQFSLALALLAGKFQALPHLITDLDLISVFCFEYSEREREMGASDNVKGLILAVASSVFIGTSFIVKKKGLKRAGAAGTRAGQSDAHRLLPISYLAENSIICFEMI